MSGVALNVITVIVGTAIGLLFGRLIKERFREIAFFALGVCTIGFGAITAVGGYGDLKVTPVGSWALLVPVFALVVGAICGEALRIEDRLQGLAAWLEKRLPGRHQAAADEALEVGSPTAAALAADPEAAPPAPVPPAAAPASPPSSAAPAAPASGAKAKSSFVEGYMTATILFCVGAMTFLGSIQAGLGDPSTLYLKSLMDGISSIALACALGIGVGFAAVSVLVIEGGLALLAVFFGDFFTPAIIASIDLVGGMMLIAIGFEILGVKKLRVANMLPALIVAILLGWALGG